MGNVLLIVLVVFAAVIALLRSLPWLFCSMGEARKKKGDASAAERWFLRALSFEERIQNTIGHPTRGVAIVSCTLGFFYHDKHRTDEAAAMFNRAIDIYAAMGRVDDSAPVYGSLGKLYLDTGALDPAQEALTKALEIYSRRSHADEAIERLGILLDLVAEKKGEPPTSTTYTNDKFGFSFVIPARWMKQRLVGQFTSTGGQIAVSHASHHATLNVAAGPPDRPEWSNMQARANALASYLATAQGRIGGLDIQTSALLGGEMNTVSAEYNARAEVNGVMRKRRHGLVSAIHGGLEYVVQWSAESDLEDQTREIIASFIFST